MSYFLTVPKDKNYRLCFQGKLREQPKYTGRILAVGISYIKSLRNIVAKWKCLRRVSAFYSLW